MRVLCFVAALLWGVGGLAQNPDDICASCHEQAKKIVGSPHASLGCTSCHEKHEAYPHPAGVPKPACAACHTDEAAAFTASVHAEEAKKGNAMAPECASCHGDAHEVKATGSPEFRNSVPETCGMCHTEVSEEFQKSVHGAAVAAGKQAAPVCTSCHGEHTVLRKTAEASPVSQGHIRETCGQCHGNVSLAKKFGLPADRIVSFDQSFHGLAAKAGSQTVANCASCHGIHNILASSDANSTINMKHLPETCGRCHPGAGTRFALGPVHFVEGATEPEPVQWIRVGYSVLIPLLIGLMLLHNAGDWFRKVFARRLRGSAAIPAAYRRPGRREIRMYPFERLQHALLASSFAVLVWTGFALKFPDAWWALPLVAWERFWPVRGTVHRGASVVFLIVCVMHAASLIFNAGLRKHWKAMWPRWNDIPEALGAFAYNVGLSSRKPRISAHSYIEKAEYWAVVWGAVIMAGTGALLWANNLALAWLPKVASDIATAIHWYEAVLATLAIVVWHFYSVIFDPDVYPMETAWLTGHSVKEHASEESEQKGAPEGTPEPEGENTDLVEQQPGKTIAEK